MKLTNYMRDAFVRAVMADTPKPDLEALEKQAHKIVLNDFLSRCPESVKAVWNDSKTRPYLVLHFHSFYFSQWRRAVFEQIAVPAISGETELSVKANDKIVALAEKKVQLEDARYALERKLRNAAYGCTTRKQLVEALPEFEKYLPADEAKAIRSMPVIANVVSEFVKAGWPKDKKAVAV